MIGWIIAAGAALLVLRNSNANSPGASGSPINQATGASLSTALGNAVSSPSNFSTGAGASKPIGIAPTKVNVVPVAGPSTSRLAIPSGADSQPPPVIRPIVAGPVRMPTPILARGPVTRGNPNVPVKGPLNPTGSFNATVAQRAISVTRNFPEVASPFWTKLQPKVTVKRS